MRVSGKSLFQLRSDIPNLVSVKVRGIEAMRRDIIVWRDKVGPVRLRFSFIKQGGQYWHVFGLGMKVKNLKRRIH